VDIVPLLTGSAGHAFLVPSPNGLSARCVVVTGNLSAEEYWLPAGIYMNHGLLCEGVPAPPPGSCSLCPALWTWHTNVR